MLTHLRTCRWWRKVDCRFRRSAILKYFSSATVVAMVVVYTFEEEGKDSPTKHFFPALVCRACRLRSWELNTCSGCILRLQCFLYHRSNKLVPRISVYGRSKIVKVVRESPLNHPLDHLTHQKQSCVRRFVDVHSWSNCKSHKSHNNWLYAFTG